MTTFLHIVQQINSYLSDYVLILLLTGAGLYFTIRTRFVQVRCFGEGLRKIFGDFSLHGKRHASGASSFQAFATAVAAQIGTGNIVGAAGAILTGGPGAIFWMWVVAFFGMATIYAEAVLAQKTRATFDDGSIHGGPVYYLKRAFPNAFGTFLAVCFAVAIVIALGLIGCMVQSNSIGETCQNALGIPSIYIGFALSLLSLFIFLGGVRHLVVVTEKLVPIMALIYIAGGLLVLLCRWQHLPHAFAMIFRYAFTPDALIGGGIGHALKTAISQGVKRGLFSNEAGMGSTPHAHALANVRRPHDQGVTAMVGVFLDTFIALTMTALVVLVTIYSGNGPLAHATGATWSETLAASGLTKTNLVQNAFATLAGTSGGNIFVAICLLFFAYSTILSWNYFGKVNFQYLFGPKATIVYSFLGVAFIFLGTVAKNDLVWELQDLFNQLMVLPNVLALFALASLVQNEAVHRE